jgi:hypothetical protein
VAWALLVALAVLVLGFLSFVAAGGFNNNKAPVILPSLVAAAPTDTPLAPSIEPTEPPPVVTSIPTVPLATLPVIVPTVAPATFAPTVAPITPAPITPAPVTPPPVTPPPPPPPTNPPPQTWAVSLDSSATQANNGDLVTFTARSSDSVTGTGYVIEIFNPDTGFIHQQCAVGSTCRIGGRRENTTDSYQARVSAPGGTNVQAVSNRVTVTWSAPAPQGWAVNLSASNTAPANGEIVTFRATANQSVTSTGFVIQIFNPDTGFIHVSCATGDTCVVRGARQDATATYQARVSAPDGSNVQAQSDRITVTWQ